jgi:hypothetical protein
MSKARTRRQILIDAAKTPEHVPTVHEIKGKTKISSRVQTTHPQKTEETG